MPVHKRAGEFADEMIRNPRGTSIIIAIFIIVILAFMGVMFVSLINTSTFSSINDLQSMQALSGAEGGVEYEQRIIARNVDWYRSADPIDTTTQNLGTGSFTGSSNIPATKLQRRLLPGATTAFVYTTNRFPTPSGTLYIVDDGHGSAEFVQYTAVPTTTSFTVTGVTVTHQRGHNVYPATTLTQAGGLVANCSSPSSFTIAFNSKFLGGGTLDIEGEEILYTGSSLSGGNLILTGVQRCQDGTSQATPPAHALNVWVTPVLVNDDSASYQAEITSTGTVGSAVRVVKKTIQQP